MTSVVIRAEALVKDYGSVRALRGVDLEVEHGEIFGFIGPNGAGKSTTIRLLLDLLRPTSGEVEVLGQNPAAGGPELRSRIGYLPGELAMSGNRTAREHLEYMVRLRGGSGANRLEPLAERFGVELDKQFRGLSKGNKQKVGVVQAFMHSPALLILDEPTSGLDPLLQREFLDLLLEAREAGATVFMSSHVLREVEEVAGRVAIIRSGEIVDVENVRVLRNRAGQHVEFKFGEVVSQEDFAGLSGLTDLEVTGHSLSAVLRGSPDGLLKAAARHEVVSWSASNLDLEELFMDFYRMPDET